MALRGDLAAAQAAIQKGNTLFKHSPSPIYNALFIIARALLLVEQGKLAQTIALAKEHQTLFQNLTLYPTMQMAILLLRAEAYAKRGEKALCEKDLQEISKKIKAFFGEREVNFKGHVALIRALNTLDMPDQSANLKRAQNALKLYEKLFNGSDKHRMQALGHDILARIYAVQKRWKEALKAANTSDYVYLTVLHKKAIDDVSRLYALMVNIFLNLKDIEAAKTYVHEHHRLFGPDHPRTGELYVRTDRASH